MHPILGRSNERLQIARKILNDLKLIELWSQYGKPIVVGSVAYNLIV